MSADDTQQQRFSAADAVVKPNDKMDEAYVYDAETEKIEQVKGETEEKSQT